MNYQLTRAEIERVAETLAPMCEGDEQLLQDMLEGETDLISVVGRMHEQFARDNEMLAGIAERKAALLEREKRIKGRAAKVKAEIGGLLRVAKLSKIELPEVTYSVREGKPTLDVADVAAVPEEYLTYKPSPNKTQINADFDPSGDLPNWLSVKPAIDIVTGRVK